MRQFFTEQHKKDGLNSFELEDMMFEADYIEGGGKTYKIMGTAIVDGERFPNFTIEFELEQEPKNNTIEEIMSIEWDSYDYVIEF